MSQSQSQSQSHRLPAWPLLAPADGNAERLRYTRRHGQPSPTGRKGMPQLPRLADSCRWGLSGDNMDTAALPADGLRQSAAVTRRTPLVLCDLIDLYAAEVGRSRGAAAYDLEQLFGAICRHTLAPSQFMPGLYARPLDSVVCWLGSAADSLPAGQQPSIYAGQLADYFARLKTGKRAAEHCVEIGSDPCRPHLAPAAAIYLDPEPLAHLIEASGQRVPAFLLCDPVPAEAPAPAPVAGAGRKRAARQAAPAPEQLASMPPLFAAQHAAWLKFWAPWMQGQPAPSQKEVQAWIAERAGSGRITRKIEEAANIIRPEEAPDQHGKYKTRP